MGDGKQEGGEVLGLPLMPIKAISEVKFFSAFQGPKMVIMRLSPPLPLVFSAWLLMQKGEDEGGGWGE